MNFAQIVLIAYSTLMLVGGIAGYASAKSMPSLVAGIVSAIVLDIAFFLARSKGRVGYLIGGATAFALTAFFAYRVYETGKFMPAGGLCGLSLIAGFLILSGSNSPKK